MWKESSEYVTQIYKIQTYDLVRDGFMFHHYLWRQKC